MLRLQATQSTQAFDTLFFLLSFFIPQLLSLFHNCFFFVSFSAVLVLSLLVIIQLLIIICTITVDHIEII